MEVIKLPINTTIASENVIEALLRLGVLYTDENGLHAVEQKGE